MITNRIEKRGSRVDGRKRRAVRGVISLPLLHSSFRPGITLTEVLISMGILTIGLLGVAAIFPVGTYYLQKGEIADNGSALAQSTFNEAVAHGWLNPEQWIVWRDRGLRGDFEPNNQRLDQMFIRPFAETLRSHVSDQTYEPDQVPIPLSAVQRQKTAGLEFGSVFVIDPMGVASISHIKPDTGQQVRDESFSMAPGVVFPAPASRLLPNRVQPTWPKQWRPWFDNVNGTRGPRWPIRRVTFRESLSVTPFFKAFGPAMAARMFSTQDVLAMKLPTVPDKPAIQLWELSDVDKDSDMEALARQTYGDYSWIITVTPTTAEARDALGTDPSAHYYEVSVVVFYKRPVAATSPTNVSEVLANRDELLNSERTVRAKIVSTGLSGGEVLLERIPAGTSAPVEPKSTPFNVVRTGQWVMLCGPHPSSDDLRPTMVARWYRVLAIEEDTDSPDERLVALRGPQWPWEPEPSGNLDKPQHLSNSLYVCITSGAVAVHSKTIRLEGSGAFGF